MGKARKRAGGANAECNSDSANKKTRREADASNAAASDSSQSEANEPQGSVVCREREGVADDSSNQSESIGDLMRELECPICKQCVRDAHITRCGHTFCYQCVSAAASAKRGCPECAAPLENDSIFPNFAINHLANKANRLLVQRRSESVIRDALLSANDADSLEAVASIAKWRADTLRSETDASRAAMCKHFLDRLDAKLSRLLEDLLARRAAISADRLACASVLLSGAEVAGTEPCCSQTEKAESGTTTCEKRDGDSGLSETPAGTISIRQRAKMATLFESLSTVYFQLKQPLNACAQPQDQTVANDTVGELELAASNRDEPAAQSEPTESGRAEESFAQPSERNDPAPALSNETDPDAVRPPEVSAEPPTRPSDPPLRSTDPKRTSVRRSDLACTALDDGGVLDEFSRVLQKALRFGAVRELCAFAFCSELGVSSRVVSSCEWDETGTKLAVAGITKRIKIYDLDTLLLRGGAFYPVHGAPLPTESPYRGNVDDSEEDGTHSQYAELANVYADQEIMCDAKISCVAWNHFFSTHLASSDYDGHVLLWDAVTGVKLHDYADHEKRAWAVDFNRHDHTLFASGSDDTRVRVWSSAQHKCVFTLPIGANVCSVQFALANRYMLAVGAADHNIYLYDLRSHSRPLHTIKESAKAVSYVKFLLPSESDLLLSGVSHQFPASASKRLNDRSPSNCVVEWDAANRRTDRVESFRQSFDTNSQKKAMERVSRQAEREPTRLADRSPSSSPSQCVAESNTAGCGGSSAMNLVSASTDSSLKIWRFEARRGVIPAENGTRCGLLRTLRGHVNEKNFVGLTTDLSDYVVCGSENNTLYCYYKHLDRPLLTYRFSEPPAPSLAPTSLFRSTSFAGLPRAGASRAGLDVSGLRSALEPPGVPLPLHGFESGTLRNRSLEASAASSRSRLENTLRCNLGPHAVREPAGAAELRNLDAVNWRMGSFDRQFSHEEVSSTSRTETHHASSNSNSHDFVSAVAWRLRSNILAVGNSQGIVKLLEFY